MTAIGIALLPLLLFLLLRPGRRSAGDQTPPY